VSTCGANVKEHINIKEAANRQTVTAATMQQH